MVNINQLIADIPKAELHVHIEGTLEPDLVISLARKNNIGLKFHDSEQLRKAYTFSNLQNFLDLYDEVQKVLVDEQDFYDMTWAYFKKAQSQNILHAEIIIELQSYEQRGISPETVINGIYGACEQAKKELGISSFLILTFLRHLNQEAAIKTLEDALPFKEKIKAVGLAGAEKPNPPSKFVEAFKMARELGFLTVAHAGEEGPSEYIWEAIDLLKVSRLDHGNRCMDDKRLMDELVKRQIPLTICPLSNLMLKVVPGLETHPLKQMLDYGILATVNSDDPSYFGGYINENYAAIAEALGLSAKDIVQLAKNSFKASFLDSEAKFSLIQRIDSLT